MGNHHNRRAAAARCRGDELIVQERRGEGDCDDPGEQECAEEGPRLLASGMDEQHRHRDEAGGREGEAADPGRALEAGGGEETEGGDP